MEKYFYSPRDLNNSIENDIKENCLIKFSFNDSNIPHFSKTGQGSIKKVYKNTVDIEINKNQKLYSTSLFGREINLDSGLFIISKFEDHDSVIFNIPKNYIWCVSNV